MNAAVKPIYEFARTESQKAMLKALWKRRGLRSADKRKIPQNGMHAEKIDEIAELTQQVQSIKVKIERVKEDLREAARDDYSDYEDKGHFTKTIRFLGDKFNMRVSRSDRTKPAHPDVYDELEKSIGDEIDFFMVKYEQADVRPDQVDWLKKVIKLNGKEVDDVLKIKARCKAKNGFLRRLYDIKGRLTGEQLSLFEMVKSELFYNETVVIDD